MNNTAINYPFLSGYLQSELQNLAVDNTFLKMKSEEDRLKYVRLLIERANIAAKKAAF